MDDVGGVALDKDEPEDDAPDPCNGGGRGDCRPWGEGERLLLCSPLRLLPLQELDGVGGMSTGDGLWPVTPSPGGGPKDSSLCRRGRWGLSPCALPLPGSLDNCARAWKAFPLLKTLLPPDSLVSRSSSALSGDGPRELACCCSPPPSLPEKQAKAKLALRQRGQGGKVGEFKEKSKCTFVSSQ